MKLTLLSCDAVKPDRRAIEHCLIEISHNINESLSKIVIPYYKNLVKVYFSLKDRCRNFSG